MQRFTLRSLIDLERGLIGSQFNLLATLATFIAHIMMQHIMIYMYKLDIDTWQNQKVNEVKNKKF